MVRAGRLSRSFYTSLLYDNYATGNAVVVVAIVGLLPVFHSFSGTGGRGTEKGTLLGWRIPVNPFSSQIVSRPAAGGKRNRKGRMKRTGLVHLHIG